jgi:hypothetical protein
MKAVPTAGVLAKLNDPTLTTGRKGPGLWAALTTIQLYSGSHSLEPNLFGAGHAS